ncbi:MAG: hypothetical protein EAZ44_09565 [Cytophagia bacterium]|nr:MAG: hypothetical protein EAZ44_09565 [Cytophagia bacterium]TAG46480.1 MAG: hypothetical protein EAZ31_00350 [Cytophagia bacterium]
MNIQVICIDDTLRPNEVPTSRWVKKGETYNIIQIDKLLMQGGAYGCKLQEIDNDDLAPYQYFRLNRFAPPQTLEAEEAVLATVDLKELEEVLV